MIQTALARRYAKALFGLLKGPEIGPTAEALKALAQAFAESREFRTLLLSPRFSREQQAKVVNQMAARAGSPPITQRFLAYLVRKNRIAQIREISDEFAKLADQAAHRTSVSLATARSLTDAERDAIRARLEEVTNSTVDLEVRVDPSLLGGLQFRIHSTIYDGTIRGQLGRMRAALSRAS